MADQIPAEAIEAAAKAALASLGQCILLTRSMSEECFRGIAFDAASAAVQAAAPVIAANALKNAARSECEAALREVEPGIQASMRADERRRLIDALRPVLLSGPIGRESGERYIRADYIRSALGVDDEYEDLP